MEQYLNGFSVITIDLKSMNGTMVKQMFSSQPEAPSGQTQPSEETDELYWYVTKQQNEFQTVSRKRTESPPQGFYIGPFLTQAEAVYIVTIKGQLSEYFTRK